MRQLEQRQKPTDDDNDDYNHLRGQLSVVDNSSNYCERNDQLIGNYYPNVGDDDSDLIRDHNRQLHINHNQHLKPGRHIHNCDD